MMDEDDKPTELGFKGFAASFGNWAHTASNEAFQKELSFRSPRLDFAGLIRDLRNWYESQRLEVQVLEYSDGTIVQCRRQGSARKWLGMNSELTTTLLYEAPTLKVTVGAGKWASKVGAGTVGILGFANPMFLPLLGTAAYGTWEQRQIRNRTLQLIAEAAEAGSDSTEEIP